ncbi:olfactory receptor 51I2 [Artibeus jamaicensis]|uniref:olfactory receptor 51I2 n=1 Tax=Artibeus jamaicensis TaxID=9417 RepID=UPI00235AAAD5|nr:olfactory receptor 51I2 [Artibeus jamaicensis]
MLTSKLYPWHLFRSTSPNSRHKEMFNRSQLTPEYFLLTGLPGLEAFYPWFIFPFCSIYLVALVGNSLILAVIKNSPSLHQPMYLFLAMLAFAELGVSVSTLPTVLGIFLLGASEISFAACLLQMFSIHSFSIMESGVLLAMSVDRFVAIYNPLRYTAILTLPRIAGTGAALGLKSVVLMFPLPFLLMRLPFCGHKVLSHSYCLHSDLIQLPCGNTRPNSILGLCIVTSTFGLDSLLIIISYVLILYTVLGITSGEGRRKAPNTCVSHICAVLVYYVPMISVALVHRFMKHAAPAVRLLLANVYLLVPPLLNPIIYSVKTKQIRQGLIHLFLQRK